MFSKSSVRIPLLAFLAYLLHQAIGVTLRWKLIGFEKERIQSEDGEPRIFAFWHNQQVFMPKLWAVYNSRAQKRKAYVIISQHGDGRIVAGAIKRLGIDSIDGSSTKGGRDALNRAVDLLNEGSTVIITPDGPRGPIYQSKAGVIRMAQKTGIPISPSALYAESKWEFSSWDKMFLPKPFSRVVLALGEKMKIEAEMTSEEFEAAQRMLNAKINELTELCKQAINT